VGGNEIGEPSLIDTNCKTLRRMARKYRRFERMRMEGVANGLRREIGLLKRETIVLLPVVSGKTKIER
jgi:hypothetical protein